jgi:hypothetical protein
LKTPVFFSLRTSPCLDGLKRSSFGRFAIFAAIRRASSRVSNGNNSAARPKRQGQNLLPGLIRYEHHQRQILPGAELNTASSPPG